MASNNGHEPAFSVAEVIGISAAAAAALGGVIIALGRTQANSSQSHLRSLQGIAGRDEVAERAARGKAFALGAAETASRRYPDARDYAAQKAESGLDRVKHRGEAFSHLLQDSILPAVVVGATKVRKNVEEQARSADTDELIEKSRHYADEAAEQLRHAGESVARTFQKDVFPAVAPVVKDASGIAEDLLDQLKDRAENVKGKGRNDRFPGVKAVSSGKESAQQALHSSSKAATDTISALMWIVASSALVYLVLLSPERREQVKNVAFDAIEQVRLLIGDFKGYETEF